MINIDEVYVGIREALFVDYILLFKTFHRILNLNTNNSILVSKTVQLKSHHLKMHH